MLRFYDTFGENTRVRHWVVADGRMKTLCGLPIQNGAPDKMMRRLEPCAACARRVKERNGS